MREYKVTTDQGPHGDLDEAVTAAKMKVSEGGDLMFWDQSGAISHTYARKHWTKVIVEPEGPPDLSKMTADEISALPAGTLARALAAEKEREQG